MYLSRIKINFEILFVIYLFIIWYVHVCTCCMRSVFLVAREQFVEISSCFLQKPFLLVPFRLAWCIREMKLEEKEVKTKNLELFHLLLSL